jgi:hypothetical protein
VFFLNLINSFIDYWKGGKKKPLKQPKKDKEELTEVLIIKYSLIVILI